MKEIIDASKKISTPIIEVKLNKDFLSKSAVPIENLYKSVRLKIEKTFLGEIVDFYKECYAPKDCYLLI
jgi:hypothetical protein